MTLRLTAAIAMALLPVPALAHNIVISNDDGLSNNVKALYDALKAQGHDVIVSVPCGNQSGMGTAVRYMRPLEPLKEDCRALAAQAGAPGAGPMTKPGFERDFFYVDGTPVMATLYGIDIVAKQRWGRAPDLVLSGPNEGQNLARIVLGSGTVSNAQFAGARGLPAIALSAGLNTSSNPGAPDALAKQIAALSAELVGKLTASAGAGQRLLPEGVVLNVNFPDDPTGAQWRLTRLGTYEDHIGQFVSDISKFRPGSPALPGVGIERNTRAPRADEASDEAVVVKKDIAVTVMQVAYEAPAALRNRAARQLKGLVSR